MLKLKVLAQEDYNFKLNCLSKFFSLILGKCLEMFLIKDCKETLNILK